MDVSNNQWISSRHTDEISERTRSQAQNFGRKSRRDQVHRSSHTKLTRPCEDHISRQCRSKFPLYKSFHQNTHCFHGRPPPIAEAQFGLWLAVPAWLYPDQYALQGGRHQTLSAAHVERQLITVAEIDVKSRTWSKPILYLIRIVIAHPVCIVPTYIQRQFLEQCWTRWSTTNIDVFQSIYLKTPTTNYSKISPRHINGQSLQRPGYETLEFIYVFLSVYP